MLRGFEREFLNVAPEPDPLLALAMEYHTRCEAYDCTVCSTSRNGVAVPANGHEVALVNRYAIPVRNELSRRAAELLEVTEEQGRARLMNTIRSTSLDFDRMLRRKPDQ